MLITHLPVQCEVREGFRKSGLEHRQFSAIDTSLDTERTCKGNKHALFPQGIRPDEHESIRAFGKKRSSFCDDPLDAFMLRGETVARVHVCCVEIHLAAARMRRMCE
jgi:hypothetical protein